LIVVLRTGEVMLNVPVPSEVYVAVYQSPVLYETIFNCPAPGKPAGTKFRAPTEELMPRGVHDLVVHDAPRLHLSDLVDRVAGVEEDAARTEYDAAVVVLAFGVSGHRAREAGDVTAGTPHDSDRIEGAADVVRGPADDDRVGVARQEGQSAVRSR
jgi:hypothetical protein